MMNDILLIVDIAPLNRLHHLRKYINEHRQAGLTLYFINDGVQWLDSEYWETIYEPGVVYYAHAFDAVKHKISFQNDVIFSSDYTLEQLLKSKGQTVYFSCESKSLTG